MKQYTMTRSKDNNIQKKKLIVENILFPQSICLKPVCSLTKTSEILTNNQLSMSLRTAARSLFQQQSFVQISCVFLRSPAAAVMAFCHLLSSGWGYIQGPALLALLALCFYWGDNPGPWEEKSRVRKVSVTVSALYYLEI